jgi:peptide/nickel transport system substrate-binding protein
VLDRWAGHWNAANIHIQRVIFRPMPDGTVRLSNLRGGALEMMERVSPTDLATLRRSPGLTVTSAPELGHQFIRFNIGAAPGSQGAFAREPKLREALEAAIDRAALNQVVFDGAFIPGNQWVPPDNAFYARAYPVPGRDLLRARRLVAESGVANPTLRLLVPNSGDMVQAAEVMQAMLREAGIELRVQVLEIGALVRAQTSGEFEASLGFWGGRSDPDGNISFHIGCDGPNNDGKYCVAAVDDLLSRARALPELPARAALYGEVAGRVLADRPYVYLWHRRNYWGLSDKVSGYTAYPDSVIRWAGLRLR